MSDKATEAPIIRVQFEVPRQFKIALDIELAKRQISVKDFCILAVAKELGIPVPGVPGEEGPA